MKSLITLFSLLIITSVQAKKLETSYMTVEIPSNLTCKQVKSLWLCKDFKKKRSDIVLYLSSKLTTPGEDFKAFEKQLKLPRTIENQNGKLINSKIYHTKRFAANKHTWVESLHFNSELQNFFSYYYFTTNKNISIAAMVSVHKGSVKKYARSLAKFKKSLKLKDIDVRANTKRLAKNSGLGAGTSDPIKEVHSSPVAKIKGLLGGGNKKFISLGLILAAIGLIAYSLKT